MLSRFRQPTIVTVLYYLAAAPLSAQAPDVARERAAYIAWLETAPNSPLKALAQQPLGSGLTLGPEDADIPLLGLPKHRLIAKENSVILQGLGDDTQVVRRERPFRISGYTLYVTASARGKMVTVFGNSTRKRPPGYYEYDSSLVFTGRLVPPTQRSSSRVLTSDGIETQAIEAGTIVASIGTPVKLRVLRIPGASGEESELEIFFQDESNGEGTYPAGRFVNLTPVGRGEYRLDFNRARNPFCAYNSVYPCPVPWRGNLIRAPVRAGERYRGGGLDVVPTSKTR